MTREEHLKYCKICINREFDPKQGLICGLTKKIADFEETCPSYLKDENLPEFKPLEYEDNATELLEIIDPNHDQLIVLRKYQDFSYAVVGGILIMIVCALIWAVITVITRYQLAYMAIGVGLVVGNSVRFFGAGVDRKFGIFGGFIAVTGCVFGNIFSQIGMVAVDESIGFLEAWSYFDLKSLFFILFDAFDVIDIVFYGLAAFAGYKYSFRTVTKELLGQLNEDPMAGEPKNNKYRMPAAIISILVVGIFFFVSRSSSSGHRIFYHDNGTKLSEGNFKNSRLDGEWIYWREDGTKELVCNYKNDVSHGLWQWYDESENLLISESYYNGLKHGIWISFHKNGIISDSVRYHFDRKHGEWRSYFDNSKLAEVGQYKLDLQDSKWTFYNEQGILTSQGNIKNNEPVGIWKYYFENGEIFKIVSYQADNKILYLELNNEKGESLVKNGSGIYEDYDEDDFLKIRGEVLGDLPVGVWKEYFPDGKINKEIEYRNGMPFLMNAWNYKGEQMVINGFGFYKEYWPDSKYVGESGFIKSGLKEEKWQYFFYDSKKINQEITYKKGKSHGEIKVFYMAGQIEQSGAYKNNKREGEWIWYHENGTEISKVTYINGQKEGKQYLWLANGDKSKLEEYSNGILKKEKIF